jgi:hypothetical protein
MQAFLAPQPSRESEPGGDSEGQEQLHKSTKPNTITTGAPDIFTGYISDVFDNEIQPEDESAESDLEDASGNSTEPYFRVHHPPPLKRQCCKISWHEAHHKKQEEWRRKLKQGLLDVEKLMVSKKTRFDAGDEGLQACWTHTIQSYLFMVVKNNQMGMKASAISAEAQRFSAKWGSHLISSGSGYRFGLMNAHFPDHNMAVTSSLTHS